MKPNLHTDFNETSHEAFINYPEQIESLMTHIKSNNIDISTHDKFIEAMKSWYKTQRIIELKMDEMPTSVLIKILKVENNKK